MKRRTKKKSNDVKDGLQKQAAGSVPTIHSARLRISQLGHWSNAGSNPKLPSTYMIDHSSCN